MKFFVPQSPYLHINANDLLMNKIETKAKVQKQTEVKNTWRITRVGSLTIKNDKGR